nr:DUF1660 family phage protein [Seonamhaeicola sp. ML3]
MPSPKQKPTFLPKLHCSIFGHDYKLTKMVTRHVKEYTCTRCNKQLTTNSNGQLVELTPKFKEINNALEHIHKVRKKRSKEKSVISSIC